MATNVETDVGGLSFLRIFEEGKRFTEEVLKENERLRLLATKLRNDLRDMEDQFVAAGASDLRERAQRLDEELREERAAHQELRSQFASVEKENHEFAERYVQVERQNSDLINMYVASYRLHSTLQYADVLSIVKEIVINMVGAERFGIYLTDRRDGRFHLICHEGLDGDEGKVLAVQDPEALAAVASGVAWYAPGQSGGDGTLALIPLRIHDRTVGVVEIRKLLVQKRRFDALDRGLFDLLGKHAATAIYSSSLYSLSERKLHTLESFLDLLRAELPPAPSTVQVTT